LVRVCRDKSVRTIPFWLVVPLKECLETLYREFREAPSGCIEASSRESVEKFVEEHCNKNLKALGYTVRLVKAVSWAGGKPDYFIRLSRV